MARLLFNVTELERFWCSTKQNYHTFCTNGLSIRVPFATTELCESGFSSLLRLKNKCCNDLNPSNDLRVALMG